MVILGSDNDINFILTSLNKTYTELSRLKIMVFAKQFWLKIYIWVTYTWVVRRERKNIIEKCYWARRPVICSNVSCTYPLFVRVITSSEELNEQKMLIYLAGQNKKS